MVTKWKPFDLPCGIEAAINRLARESKRDGFVSCTAQFGDGRTEYVSLFDTEGNQHYIRPNGSRWLEMRNKEGEDGRE